jgi:Sulfotransferase family
MASDRGNDGGTGSLGAVDTSAFPFIVGVGRSGTTLVRAILDTHPDLAIPGESHFIPVMARNRGRYETRSGLRVERFLQDLARHPRFGRWGLSHDRVSGSLRPDPPVTLAEAIRRVYALFAETRGKTRYGDKTPAYVHHIPSLARLLPEARFVHLVRDGRDVALSRLDHPTMSAPLSDLAVVWRRGVEKGRRAGRHLGPSRYMEMRYEDLVKDPEEAARSLCRFIGLSFDPAMLRYHERANEIIRPTQHPGSHGRIHLPPTTGLRDWRVQMRARDVETFDALAGGLLEELGYERGGARRTLGDRVTARRTQLGMEARRVARAVRKRVKRRPGGVSDGD